MPLTAAAMLGVLWALAGSPGDATDLPTPELLREKPALLLADVPAFLEYQRAVRADIEAGRIGPLRSLQKRELYAAQDRLDYLLADARAIEELSARERVEVYNAQSKVAAILADAPGKNEVCVREKPLGSNRLVISCLTHGERRDEKLRSQTLLRRLYQASKHNARAGS